MYLCIHTYIYIYIYIYLYVYVYMYTHFSSGGLLKGRMGQSSPSLSNEGAYPIRLWCRIHTLCTAVPPCMIFLCVIQPSTVLKKTRKMCHQNMRPATMLIKFADDEAPRAARVSRVRHLPTRRRTPQAPTPDSSSVSVYLTTYMLADIRTCSLIYGRARSYTDMLADIRTCSLI